MKLGKILGTVAGVAGAATGNPWIGAAGQLLGGMGGGEGGGTYTPPKTGWKSLEEIFGKEFTDQLVGEAKASHDLPRTAPAFRPFSAAETGDTSVFRPNAAISLAGYDTNRKLPQQGQKQTGQGDGSGASGDAIMGLMKLQELAGGGMQGMQSTSITNPWQQRKGTMTLEELTKLGSTLKDSRRGEGLTGGGYVNKNGQIIDLSQILRGSA